MVDLDLMRNVNNHDRKYFRKEQWEFLRKVSLSHLLPSNVVEAFVSTAKFKQIFFFSTIIPQLNEDF